MFFAVLTDKFEGASPLQNRAKFRKRKPFISCGFIRDPERRGDDVSHGKLGADHRLIPETLEEGNHSEEDV